MAASYGTLEKTFKENNTKSIITGIGVLGGIFYALKTKKQFWGIAGFAFLGGVSGAIVSNVVTNIKK